MDLFWPRGQSRSGWIRSWLMTMLEKRISLLYDHLFLVLVIWKLIVRTQCGCYNLFFQISPKLDFPITAPSQECQGEEDYSSSHENIFIKNLLAPKVKLRLSFEHVGVGLHHGQGESHGGISGPMMIISMVRSWWRRWGGRRGRGWGPTRMGW